MPIITDKRKASALKDNQQNCKICLEKPNRSQLITECEICQCWFCPTCTEIPEDTFKYALEKDLCFNFICKDCKAELPQLRELMQIREKQKMMEEDIADIKKNVETQQNIQIELKESNEDHEKRLKSIENILKENKLDDENFPKLPIQTKKLNELIFSQKSETRKLDEKLQKQADIAEEQRRKAGRQRNLIIYGIPETKLEINEQLKEDFYTIQEVYANRVPIEAKDITELVRLGNKTDKIRPIKVTFASQEKRLKILRNNINLRIYGEQYGDCKCKNEPGRHIHVNVTNDKTQQERETEKALRDELNRRRTSGENDLTIKNGKITKRNINAQTRWADIVQNV